MAQLIDTSVFIAVERGRLDLDVVSTSFPMEPIAVATITVSELLAGVYYANTEERRHRRRTFVEQIISNVPVLPFNLSVADTYARLLVELRKAGKSVGAHDLQIAATALSHNLEVATYDVRDFGRIPDLTVRQLDKLA